MRIEKDAGSRAAPHTPDLLPEDAFAHIVAHAPLVAIDLLVQDTQQRLLLGWRNNPPARGYWFVPGGRIRKNEPLAEAFARISKAELGQEFQLEQSILMGVHQHFYQDDFRGQRGASTHYVVLAHKLWLGDIRLSPPDSEESQHSRYRWAGSQDIAQDLLVHPYARAYFSH